MNVPIAPADADHIALPNTRKAKRQGGHDVGKVEGAVGGAFVVDLWRHSGLAVKRQRLGHRRFLQVQRQHPRRQPSRACGDQFGPKLCLKPTRKANVIRVMVGDHHARDRFAAKRPFHQPAPNVAPPARGKARVDHRPTVTFVQRIDVHMVKLHRQRQAQPDHAGRDLNRRPLCGRRFPRVAQAGYGFGGGGLIGHQGFKSSTSSA